MLLSLREETEGKLEMLLSQRKNGLDSSFKEVRVSRFSKPPFSCAHYPHFSRFLVLRPLFSWGGREVRIFRIFPVSGFNR